MKRTYRFIEPSGTVVCTVDGHDVELPIFGGILKHPTTEQLASLLVDPIVARRYTVEALRKAPWCALQRFPRPWLLVCMEGASLPDGRRRALEWLFSP